MGLQCCKTLKNENAANELSLDDDRIFLHEIFKVEPAFGKISKAKTMARKEPKNTEKSDANVVVVSPGTFVLENQGILSDNYEFISKLGQGIS